MIPLIRSRFFPLPVVCITLLVSLPSISGQETQESLATIFREIPVWDGYLESIVNISNPRLLNPNELLFCDDKDHRVVRVDFANQTIVGIGREGEGPGEFLGLGNLVIKPDGSSIVYDWRQFRLSAFDGDGVFLRSTRFNNAAGGMLDLTILQNGDIALIIGGLSKDDEYTGKVIIMTPELRQLGSFDAPNIPTEASINHPWNLDISRRKIVTGTGNTVLIGNSDDYNLRRYSSTGELIQDWGSLDSSFQPTVFRITAEGRGIVYRRYNSIDCLCEIEGKGFVISQHTVTVNPPGIGPVYGHEGFLDVWDYSGQLLNRMVVPDGMLVGNIGVFDENLYVVTFHEGRFEFADIKIYASEIGEVFR